MIDCDKSILGFSGGKDSVAISKFMLCQGIRLPHVAIVNTELDYPMHIEFIKKYCAHHKVELHLVDLKQYGIDFLKKKPEFIFPENSSIKARWFQLFQQKGLKNFAKTKGYDTIVFGRRRADGNSIKSEYYETKDGMKNYFPLMTWSNARTMEYIEDEMISPIYSYPEGKVRGTHTINIANQYGSSVEDALNLIRAIDRNLYPLAVELIEYKRNNLK